MFQVFIFDLLKEWAWYTPVL